jgi:hypothetical protein
VRPASGGSVGRAVTVQVHSCQVGRGRQTGGLKTVVLALISVWNVVADARTRMLAN